MKKKEINIDKKSIERARSFLSRVSNKLNEAKDHFKSYHYSESISASQECIELSLKAVFLLLGEKYAKRHWFKENEFKKILKKIPDELKYLDFPKLYLYSKFWESFHTIAKYGFENLGIGADKLFGKEEANLALRHAEKCKNAADKSENYILIRRLVKEYSKYKGVNEGVNEIVQEAVKVVLGKIDKKKSSQ